MTATGYSFQMAGGVPVVTALADIDTSTAGELRAILRARRREPSPAPGRCPGIGTCPGFPASPRPGATHGRRWPPL